MAEVEDRPKHVCLRSVQPCGGLRSCRQYHFVDLGMCRWIVVRSLLSEANQLVVGRTAPFSYAGSFHARSRANYAFPPLRENFADVLSDVVKMQRTMS